MESLQRIPGKEVTKALLEMLKRTKPEKKPAVVLALAARKEEAAFIPICSLLKSKDDNLRITAIKAIRKFAVTDAQKRAVGN